MLSSKNKITFWTLFCWIPKKLYAKVSQSVEQRDRKWKLEYLTAVTSGFPIGWVQPLDVLYSYTPGFTLEVYFKFVEMYLENISNILRAIPGDQDNIEAYKELIEYISIHNTTDFTF